MVREVQAALPEYQYIARFDVASFYETINHKILLTQLENLCLLPRILEVVRQYLASPDTEGSGVGLSAGGSLSPLLGAIYLAPLDRAFAKISCEFADTASNDLTVIKRREWTYGNAKVKAENQEIFYRRYMDDIIILAKTRWKFRNAIRMLHRILEGLCQKVHRRKKVFIGRVEHGFDLLGYHFAPGKKLVPSTESFCRMLTRASRFYERGASEGREALAVCITLADLSTW